MPTTYGAVVPADGGGRVAKGKKPSTITIIKNDLLLVVYDDRFTTGQSILGSNFGYVVREEATVDLCCGALLVHFLPRCGLLKLEPVEFQEVLG